MRSEVTPEAVTAVLNALVGTTAPQGDTHWDDESQANVPKFEAVCNWVYDRLYEADRSYDSPYWSQKRTARMVVDAAGDLAILFHCGHSKECPMCGRDLKGN